MFGYTHDELLGVPVMNAVHPDDRERLTIEVSKVLSGGEARDFEICVLHKDGSHRWMAWSAVRYADEQALYAIGHDVTDRHIAREALAEHARQEQCISELSTQALASDDLGTLMNAAVAQLRQFLAVDYTAILELQRDGKEFLMRAGGWLGAGRRGPHACECGAGYAIRVHVVRQPADHCCGHPQ